MATFAPLSAQRPAFRASTEAVYATATVIDQDGRLVTDLTERDFEIRDNGVPREITIFRNDTVPFAIVVMMDVSGSMLANMGLMRQAIEQLVRRFEPGDRANIGSFGAVPMVGPRFTSNLRTLLGWVGASMGGVGVPCVHQWTAARAMSSMASGSAIWDGVECGIEVVGADAETPRRVVVLVSDGLDNISRATPASLIRQAESLGIMVYVIGMLGKGGIDPGALRSLADQTGGGYFVLNSSHGLAATFARVADELRHQYVFGFTPATSATGRHDLQVRALRSGVITRARRVYMEAVPTPSVPTTLNATTSAPAVSDDRTRAAAETGIKGREAAIESFERYERGEWAIPRSATRVDFDHLLRAAPSWIRARGPAHESRRRLAAAGYLLELLMAHARDIALWQPGQFAASALEEACELLRAGPVSPDELWWHAGSIGLLEQVGVGGALAGHMKHAESRFPHEGRWALARVVVEELQTWPERRDEKPFSVARPIDARLTEALRRAAAIEPLGPEAHLRWGYYELRRGRLDAALAHFEQVGTPTDIYLRYWLHLFRGQALERKGRVKDAVASYQHAFAAVPAQSAAIALGAALVEDRRPSEAAALVFRTLALQPPPSDPWDSYTSPDARFLPLVIERLRKAIVQ